MSFLFYKVQKMTQLGYYNSPLGDILIEANDLGLCGLWFMGQKHFPKRLEMAVIDEADCKTISDAKAWLDAYFSRQQPDPTSLRLCPEGSEFQKQVWDILLRIPYGQTRSYGQIAAELEKASGRKMSARAVGAAVGRNPVLIIIPCHRVIGAKGALTGYAAGIERKSALLELENSRV